jgi:general secretion pathway protein G
MTSARKCGASETSDTVRRPGGFLHSFLRRRWVLAFPRMTDEGQTFAGFTLLELMVVIAIIGALSAISLPMYLNYVAKARYTKTLSDIYGIQKLVVLYQHDFGGLPITLNQVGADTMRDPWGNPYQYMNIQWALAGGNGPPGPPPKPRKDRFTHPINNDFDLYSMGPDGNSNAALTANASRDDIIRASDGNYVGPALNY